MKPTPTKVAPRRKLAAFRLSPSSLVRLRQIAARHQLSQSRILETLIYTATLAALAPAELDDVELDWVVRVALGGGGRMNASKSTAQITGDAIRLNAETIAAGSRCTELRSVRDKTRRGSAQHTAAAHALFDARANHAELERQRDSAWAVANSRR